MKTVTLCSKKTPFNLLRCTTEYIYTRREDIKCIRSHMQERKVIWFVVTKSVPDIC